MFMDMSLSRDLLEKFKTFLEKEKVDLGCKLGKN